MPLTASHCSIAVCILLGPGGRGETTSAPKIMLCPSVGRHKGGTCLVWGAFAIEICFIKEFLSI